MQKVLSTNRARTMIVNAIRKRALADQIYIEGEFQPDLSAVRRCFCCTYGSNKPGEEKYWEPLPDFDMVIQDFLKTLSGSSPNCLN